MKKMKISLDLPEPYINRLDELVSDHFYPTRNEAIRIAIKDLLKLHGKL